MVIFWIPDLPIPRFPDSPIEVEDRRSRGQAKSRVGKVEGKLHGNDGDLREVKRGKLRVGVIGVGHLGEYHVQKYKAIRAVELVGVVDTNLGRANEIARLYNTRAYRDYHEILNMVDAVSLAVPTEMHFDVAKDILFEGVHLLIEKPITHKLEDADTLISMAEEKDLTLQVGHVERFNPAVVEMESMVKRPILIESRRLSLFSTRGTDVDVVLDLMIHDLDIILHIVPSEVREIHAVGISVLTGKTDIASARITFGNGVVANLTANRVSEKAIREIHIFQPDAHICVDCIGREIGVTNLGGDVKDAKGFHKITSSRMKYPDRDPLFDQISSFVDVIIKGSSPVVTGRDGQKALRVALDIIDQIGRGSRNFQAIR